MAEAIGALRAEMSAGHAQFAADMKKAKDAVQANGQGMSSAMMKVKGSFDSTVGGITKMHGALVALGAVLSAGVILNNFRNIVNSMDKMEETSQKTGVGVETLQVFSMAAKMAGVESDSLTKGLGKLSKNMYEGSDAFAKIGINTKDAQGQLKLTDVILLEIADKFKTMPDGAEKTALAMQMFGKAGAELIPILNMGSAEIQALRESMGYLFTTDDANRAAAFNDAVDISIRVLQGMQMQVLSGALPAMLQMAEAFKVAGKEGDSFKGMGETLGDIMKWAAGTAYFLSASIQTVGVKVGAWIDRLKLMRKGLSGPPGNEKEGLGIINGAESSSLDAIWASYEAKRKALEKPIGIPSARKRGGGTEDDSEARKKAISDAEKILKMGEARLADMQKEVDLYGETSRAAKMKYEVEHGELSKIDPLTKSKLIALAEEIDLLDEIKQLDEGIAKIDEEEQQGIDALNQQNAALKLQAETFGMTERAATLYKMSLDGATASQLQFADAMLRAKERQEEVKKVLEEIKTPQEEYNATVGRLKVLIDEGSLSWDQYTVAMKKAQDTLDKALNKEDATLKDLQKAIEGWGKQSAAAIADFAMTGKTSFSDMAQSIIRDMLEMIIYQKLMKGLFDGISSWVGSMGTGSTTATANIGTWQTASAQSLANPAVKSSNMMAASNEKAGDKSGLTVVINNNGDNQVSTATKETPQGEQLIVTIDKINAGQMGRRGSASNKMLRQGFNARPALGSR